MNDNIRIAVKIGMLLIVLAFIASPVAAASFHIKPVTKYTYQSFLPADKSSVAENPLFQYIPVTNINTNFKTPSFAGFEDRWTSMIAGSTCGCS